MTSSIPNADRIGFQPVYVGLFECHVKSPVHARRKYFVAGTWDVLARRRVHDVAVATYDARMSEAAEAMGLEVFEI